MWSTVLLLVHWPCERCQPNTENLYLKTGYSSEISSLHTTPHSKVNSVFENEKINLFISIRLSSLLLVN